MQEFSPCNHAAHFASRKITCRHDKGTCASLPHVPLFPIVCFWSAAYREEENSTSPVVGFRMNKSLSTSCLKLNICVMEFAIVSNEPAPMRSPSSQLSSTKWIVELWSVTEWSTKFRFAHGEITK